MKHVKTVLLSTIGKKVLVGLTGLALVGFVIAHLLGNLTLLAPTPDLFNLYAHKLESLGPFLYAAEALLGFAFLVHIVLAVVTTKQNKQARAARYQVVAPAGGPSKKTVSSTTMIFSGLILLVFTILHVRTFKFGPGMAQGYVATIHGDGMRDLHRLVVEIFQQEIYVAGYVLAMLFLGFHLRHGFWSAFQSLGVNHPRFSNVIYTIGAGLAILLTVGFVLLPIWIYMVY